MCHACLTPFSCVSQCNCLGRQDERQGRRLLSLLMSHHALAFTMAASLLKHAMVWHPWSALPPTTSIGSQHPRGGERLRGAHPGPWQISHRDLFFYGIISCDCDIDLWGSLQVTYGSMIKLIQEKMKALAAPHDLIYCSSSSQHSVTWFR